MNENNPPVVQPPGPLPNPAAIIQNAASATIIKMTPWRRVFNEAGKFNPEKNYVEIPEKHHVAAFFAKADAGFKSNGPDAKAEGEYFLGLMMVIKAYAPKPTNEKDANAMAFLDKCLTVLQRTYDA